MTVPLVFISRNRIKEGKADDFQKHYRDSVPPIEAGKPATLVQVAYVNADGTEVDFVRLFPSAEGLDLQLQGADERSKRAYEFIQPTRIEIYGRPSDTAMERLEKIAGSGVEVSIKPDFIGGFLRLKAG